MVRLKATSKCVKPLKGAGSAAFPHLEGLEKATMTEPSYSEFVYDRAIKFSPKK